MGEIADEMITGRCCSNCGMYFSDDNWDLYEHGYPVVCDECWAKYTHEEKQEATRNGIQRALVTTF